MSADAPIIKLQERGSTEPSVELSEDDQEFLNDHPHLKLNHGPEIEIGQYIGTVGLPSGAVIEVSPKDSLQGFKPLYYLAKAGRIREELVTGPREIGFTVGQSFLDIVGSVFCEEVDHLISQGLQKDYVVTTEATPHVRGQLQISEQMSTHEPLATAFESRYNQLTLDIPINRLLVYTANELTDRVTDKLLEGRLASQLSRLQQRITLPATPPDPTQITLTKETQSYRPLLKLIEKILEESYIDTFGRKARLLESVLINTETLFEEVIYRTIAELVNGTRYMIHGDGDPDNVAQSSLGHLLWDRSGGKLQGLEPDIFLKERATPVWIADAKWREDSSPKRNNLYQVAAYQQKASAPGIMFYPAQGGTIEGIYELTSGEQTTTWNRELRVVEVPLGADSYQDFEQAVATTVGSAIGHQLDGIPT